MLVLLSEVLQALLSLCLIGRQVHNKALECPILCLRECAIVQTSFFLHRHSCLRSILDSKSGAEPCKALLAFSSPEGFLSYRP